MPKEVLSKDQIGQIANAMSSDEAGLPECEASIEAASDEKQQVIKSAWKLKLRADRLVGAKKQAESSTEGS
jgi:hypothetical protein